MSIYATGPVFKICRWGDPDEWVEVTCQLVPSHIGHSEDGIDHYAGFLPPVVAEDGGNRAAVFITNDTVKRGQQYIDPLLVLTGAEVLSITFFDLFERLEQALDEQEGLAV